MSAFGPGMVLADRFEVVRRLGAGGIAEVFQARDRVSGQEVALKALHDHLAQDPALSARFRREMAVTRSLDHPAIVRVFDLHEHDGRPFFSMEILRGRTLASRLAEGPLPPPEARRIAGAVCEALRPAHGAGIVHRDLKPQNVFLCDDGGVKLLDFGLARVAGQARLTAQSMVMGTPGYIAPELLSGADADARADVYSLGATLFEMLTGRQAFGGTDPYQVLRQQREGPPEAPGPEGAVAHRMLEPDPERRFLDAEQVLRALSGERVPAPPEPLPAISAGQSDLIVHHLRIGSGAKLAEIVARLGGGKLPRGWRARLAIDGKNRLVAAASRDTADAIATLCAEQGFAAMVVPAKRRWRALEWLGRNSVRAGLAAALGMLGWFGFRVWKSFPPFGDPMMNSGMLLGLALIGGVLAFLGFLPVASILALAAAPPLRDLPAGDPALRRLVQGIGRRVARLRERCAALPAPQRMLLDDLLREAGETESVAVTLAGSAAAATADDPDADTLPHGTSRDRIAARLLEIAAALDDALAVAHQPTPGGEAASGALARLREEIGFARKALPDANR